MFGHQSRFQPKSLNRSLLVGAVPVSVSVTFSHISSKGKVKLQLVFTDCEWESFHPARGRRVYTDSVHPVTRVDRETCIQHMGVIKTWSYNQTKVTQ